MVCVLSQWTVFWGNRHWEGMIYCSAIAIEEGLSISDFKVTGKWVYVYDS